MKFKTIVTTISILALSSSSIASTCSAIYEAAILDIQKTRESQYNTDRVIEIKRTGSAVEMSSSVNKNVIINPVGTGASMLILSQTGIAASGVGLLFTPVNLLRKEIKISYYNNKASEYKEIKDILASAKLNTGTSSQLDFYEAVEEEVDIPHYSELSDYIVELDRQGVFCSGEEVMDYDEVLKTVIDHVKFREKQY